MDKLGGFHTYLNAQAEEYMISNTDIRYFFDTYYDTTSSNAVRTIRYCLNSISIR